MKQQAKPERSSLNDANGITRLAVSGYKSISQEQSIDMKPLTVLAGANSSGKSSIMQPLLLLKQTLEASYDPGALLLNGPNVRFTSVDQLFSRTGNKKKRADTFRVGIEIASETTLTISFHRQPKKGIEIQQMTFISDSEKTALSPGMTHDEIISIIPSSVEKLPKMFAGEKKKEPGWTVVRDRCFLLLALKLKDGKEIRISIPGLLQGITSLSPGMTVEPYIRELIHLPGLRGNPERTYPVTAVGSMFPGTFQEYTASVIAQWQADNQEDKIEGLSKDLERLGLTWKVHAKPINETQVEIQVGRLTRAARGGAGDLVNIADVGFGLSQTLPLIVAIHAAKPGQLLYVEQPEIHLHPGAQFAMARVLADAANRGVRVVIETHSSLLLLGVQTIVAEGALSPDKLKLHWFKRRENGATEIRSADLDEAGAFGDWPEDFDKVALDAQSRYLNAAEARLMRK
ncbi:MAG: AAA family ATPase [bacterium]